MCIRIDTLTWLNASDFLHTWPEDKRVITTLIDGFIMDSLRRSIRAAPVVDRNGYEYFVHGVTDGIPRVEPDVLRDIATTVERRVDLEEIDLIVTPEAMGIHHATALSLATDIPFVVVRKRSYSFDDEVAVHQATSYSENECYLNDVQAGERVLLIDDVLSSGGTIRAVYDALETVGADIRSVVVIIRRTDVDAEDLPTDVTSLVDVVVEDGSVKIVE